MQFQFPQVTAHYVPYAEMPEGQPVIVGAKDAAGWEAFLPILDAGIPADRIEEIEKQVSQMLTETFVKGYEACGRRLAECMIAEGIVIASAQNGTAQT